MNPSSLTSAPKPQRRSKLRWTGKIALLFILVCVGTLNGMENPEREYGHYTGLQDLSPEIKVMIIHALNTYDFPDDVIEAIKAISMTDQNFRAIVHYMYGNQKGFTQLAHTLADKFGETTESIAKKFKTPAGDLYLDLSNQLHDAIHKGAFKTALELIKQGADVNFSAGLLISILHKYKTLDDTVNALKEATFTNDAFNKMIAVEYGDLKGFTTLVHALSVLFKTDTETIAKKFDTQAADTYLELGHELLVAIGRPFPLSLKNASEFINNGADVNFIAVNTHQTPLKKAITGFNVEGVQLLLNAGVKPKNSDLIFASRAVDLFKTDESRKIKKLIEDAMQQ